MKVHFGNDAIGPLELDDVETISPTELIQFVHAHVREAVPEARDLRVDIDMRHARVDVSIRLTEGKIEF